MALTTRSIVTLNEVKDFLGINEANTFKDDMLETWIDIVSGSIEDYLDSKVKVQEVEEIADGNGSRFFYPRYVPVVALYGDTDAEKLASVQYRNGPTEDWTDLIDTIDYLHVSSFAPWQIEILQTYRVFYRGEKNIRVKYWAGWVDVPGDIRKVCLEMVNQMWNESRQGNDMLGKSSVVATTQGGSESVTITDLGPRWEKVLHKYRRISP